MVTTDLDKLGKVHFTQSRNGIVARDFEIDPSKVDEVQREIERTDSSGKDVKSFRYVIAIGGDTRADAAHEFHDRILHYPTDHGIFAYYKAQIGVAQLLLGVPQTNNGANKAPSKPSAKELKEQERVESFRNHLHGHNMLVINGLFKNEKEFVQALQNAAQSRPGQHLPIPELPSLFFDTAVYDPLIVAGDALKTAGTISKRVAPNIPGHRIAHLAGDVTFTSGVVVQNVANRLQQLSKERNNLGLHR